MNEYPWHLFYKDINSSVGIDRDGHYESIRAFITLTDTHWWSEKGVPLNCIIVNLIEKWFFMILSPKWIKHFASSITPSASFHDDIIMETFSALLTLSVGNQPFTGGCPSQRPVTRSFDVFFDLCLKKRLGKQSRCRWIETPSRPLWRHYTVTKLFTMNNNITSRITLLSSQYLIMPFVKINRSQAVKEACRKNLPRSTHCTQYCRAGWYSDRHKK